jgi:transposase-like protein
MTTRDIQEIVKDLYGVDVSPDLISRVTDNLESELNAWQSRALPSVFPIVFFDGIVVHVRGADAKVSPHTVYVALGIDLEGQKQLLGLWIAKSEGAKFWLGCLTDLRNRGLEDIFICCVDGLAGFPEAIRTAYPEARVQLCLVHLVRAAIRYVASKDAKAVAGDLKKIYTSPTVASAEEQLEAFAKVWDAKYPTISKQWRIKWTDIISMFDFPEEIRRTTYTTNAIESLNSAIRKFTKNRKQYPSEQSAQKLVFMAIREASKRWTRPIKHWKQALNHFAILFPARMPKDYNA